MNRLYDGAGDLLRKVYDHRLQGPAVLDAERFFPNGARFVEQWRAVREEALEVAGRIASVPRFHELMASQADISANDDRDWRLFVLKAYGVSVARNMARCPRTAKLLRACPEVLSASISFLAPHKHIPPHRGPFRGIVRFHLGLSVPLASDGRAAAVLTIDGVPHYLADGDSLLWDDTYTHEVTNNSEQMRAALLLDVWRPEMPWDLKLLSRAIVTVVGAGVRLTGMESF